MPNSRIRREKCGKIIYRGKEENIKNLIETDGCKVRVVVGSKMYLEFIENCCTFVIRKHMPQRTYLVQDEIKRRNPSSRVLDYETNTTNKIFNMENFKCKEKHFHKLKTTK